jgi:phospholipid N-methyltransferase
MQRNIKPNKKLGQNFLINSYTINTIIEILNISEDDLVLEVGPGQGALTKHIIAKTKNYVGVEKDKKLCDFLLSEYTGSVDIRNEDILKTQLNKIYKEKYRVIGNIPYNISTKILMRCLENKDHISSVYFMMQKEFVDRIMSGDSRYFTGEFSRKCNDGTVGYHTFSARPVTKAKKVIGIEGFLIDTTDRKQAEEAKAKLEIVNRQRIILLTTLKIHTVKQNHLTGLEDTMLEEDHYCGGVKFID